MKSSISLDRTTKDKQSALGQVLETYRGRQLRGKGLVMLLLLGFAAISLPLGYAIWRSYEAFTSQDWLAILSQNKLWIALSALGLLTTILLWIVRLRIARRFVAVHQNGMRYRLVGFRPRSIRWKEIAGISTSITQTRFLGLSARPHYRLVIWPSIGNPIHVREDILALPNLISHIKVSYYPQLLESARDNLNAGRWLHSGALDLNSTSLQLNRSNKHNKPQRKQLSELEQIEVRSGYMVIELKKSSIKQPDWRIPVSRILNIEILLQLIEEYGSTDDPKPNRSN